MKTGNVNVKGMGFGFSTINVQRNVHVEPQLIATSSEGNFRLTPPVSRVLGIGAGDYLMFINNIANIDAAIINNDPQVVEFCASEGLEVGTPEATIAIHKEFDLWAIAKGILEYDVKGNAKTATERITKKDKENYVLANFDNMLETASNEADEDLKAVLFHDGITKEEQVEILMGFVVPRSVPKYKGAKCANPAGLTGIGTSLTFADSNIWRQLKADMGENAETINRVYDVDIDNVQDIEVSDGYKTVAIKALILGSYVDQKPIRVAKSKTDDDAEKEYADDDAEKEYAE